MRYNFNQERIHPFLFNNEYFLLDVNTGSLFTIDGITYKFVNILIEKKSLDLAEEGLSNKYDRKEVSSTRKEVEQLIRGSLLFSPPPRYFESSLVLKSLCLNIAYTCNFACKYCFAKQGNYGEKNSLMSWGVAKRSIDFLYENSPERHHLEIDFFGGGSPCLTLIQLKKQLNTQGKHIQIKSGDLQLQRTVL